MACLLSTCEKSLFNIHFFLTNSKFKTGSNFSKNCFLSPPAQKVSGLKPLSKILNPSLLSKAIPSTVQKRRIITPISLYYVGRTSTRVFHTSERRCFHPIIWYAAKPILKLFAVLSGRGFRKWWKDLPPNKKKYFIGVLKENKNKIAAFILACTVLSLLYYVNHLEETPITKRKRFMAFNSKQLKKINEFEFQQIMAKMQGSLLPPHHPYVLRVKSVVDRILSANCDIPEVKGKKWGIAVVDSSIENAFVLPVGYVFVFTGMLNLCSNDDQLGIILSHEIAHCLQNHGILLQLPYNRKIETEADEVGLQLAAKACFDVRESSAFWTKMAILNKTMGKMPQIEFLSTHPNHETRSEYLDNIMNEAIQLRTECNCPRLKSVDPRKEVEVVTKVLEVARRKYLQQHPKPVYVFYY